LPIAAGIAVTTNGKLNLDFTDEIVNNSLHKAIELVCLYTWRITKGVYKNPILAYRFEPATVLQVCNRFQTLQQFPKPPTVFRLQF